MPCGQTASIPSGPGDTTTQPPGSNTSGTGGSTGNPNTGGNNNSGSTTPVNNPGGASGGSVAQNHTNSSAIIGSNANGPYVSPATQTLVANNVLNITKKQGAYSAFSKALGHGRSSLQKNNYAVQYLAQTSGFYRPPMTGLAFVPSIFRKTIKTLEDI